MARRKTKPPPPPPYPRLGSSRLAYRGLPRDGWRDAYHVLLTMPLIAFFAVMAGAFLIINTIFASLYLLDPGGVHPWLRQPRRLTRLGSQFEEQRFCSNPGRLHRGAHAGAPTWADSFTSSATACSYLVIAAAELVSVAQTNRQLARAGSVRPSGYPARIPRSAS